ncbi:MAG: phosphotransferase family protein [Gammaproteobacteria bacterium]|nr:phosphotransferase family protein [Gammaproteobacteria bacterium]
MSRVLTPNDASSRLPGWQGASWKQLDGGLSNRTWLLEKDGSKAVLKIDEATRQPPFNTREQEAVIQSAAAEHGLANSVLHAGDGLYLTEYVEGSVWSASSFSVSDNIESLAAALRRLHFLPPTGRRFDSRSAAAQYAASIDADRSEVERCMNIVEGLSEPPHRCCCHNDLVAENILSMPDIRFLDWEYACDNDPLFDLATIVEHHQLQEPHVTDLLDAYFDGDGERWRARLAEQRRHYAALLWLWLAAQPESTGRD